MARWARETGVILRFIEYMDVGHSNGWRLDEVVAAEEVVETLAAVWPVEAAEPSYRGEVAGRWRYADGGGEFGVISSVTQPFCRDCTRARISAEGKLYTCLFAVDGHDLRAVLRSGASDAELTGVIESIWLRRGDRYSELRSAATSSLPKIEMFAMGG
jgi:cyclic pyranopterin phosphate synthase